MVDSKFNRLYIPINQISTVIHSLNIKSKMWNSNFKNDCMFINKLSFICR